MRVPSERLNYILLTRQQLDITATVDLVPETHSLLECLNYFQAVLTPVPCSSSLHALQSQIRNRKMWDPSQKVRTGARMLT